MKILHLENDHKASESGALINWLKDQNAEVKFIGRAYNSGEEIAKNINWCDILAFSSTFHYMPEIQSLLTKVLLPIRKKPMTIVINGYQAPKRIADLVDDLAMEWVSKFDKGGENIGYYELNESKADEIAHSMRHFELIEVIDYFGNTSPITTLNDRIDRHAKKMAFELEYKKTAINRPTGRTVKIGNLFSVVGKEWETLKEGDIVAELDMSKIDPSPGWGIWVMGATEPVKLIGRRDARGYAEYEMVDHVKSPA